MSYYFYVETNPKNKFWKRKNKIIFSSDTAITYNYNKIFIALLGETPYEWEYLKTTKVKNKIYKAITMLENNPNKYAHLLPENGWGTIDGCMHCLKVFFACAYLYPNGYFKFST